MSQLVLLKFSKKISRNFLPLLKYCLVGILSTAIDLGTLYLLVEYVHFPILGATSISFFLAVLNGFIFHKFWTFRNSSSNYRKLFTKFLIISLIGLGLTLFCMHMMTSIFQLWYLFSKILTSSIVFIWNFLGNKLWTFRTNSKKRPISSDSSFFDLSIVIPAYNEEKRIGKTLSKIDDYLSKEKMNTEIIIVNDGSKDKTADIIHEYELSIKNLKLINLEKNYGKGFAVKKGIQASNGKYILFTDADNSTPIEEVEKLLTALKQSNVDVVIGSRYMPDSKVEIKQPKFRIAIGRLGNLLISFFLLEDIKDTQCGFKLFKREAAKQIFVFQKVKKFAFDIEIIVIAKNLGYSIKEVPVRWYNSPESRVRPIKDAFFTLKDLFYIKFNLLVGRYTQD